MFESTRVHAPHQTIKAEVSDVISDFAREALIVLNLCWLHQELMKDNKNCRARERFRNAFDLQSFRWVEYYALGTDDLCYMSLIVSFDPGVHARRLRIHPRIAPTRAWVDQIAPTLRIAVEQFKYLVDRCELYVVPRMKVTSGWFEYVDSGLPSPKLTRSKTRSESFEKKDAESLHPIIWAPGRMHKVSEEIIGLEELRTGLTFSDSLKKSKK
jgi:hypothetical protein